MKTVKLLIAVSVILLAAAQLANAKDIVLQNGSNGYSGCIDSWILQGAIETIVMDAYMPERFDVYCDTCLT
jgi:hypothetical protein